MKKKYILILSLIILFLFITGCGSSKSKSRNDSNTTKNQVSKKREFPKEEPGEFEEPKYSESEYSEPEMKEGKDFREMPEDHIEYFLPPGSSKDIGFTVLSFKDDSTDEWEVETKGAERHRISIYINDVSSEPIPVDFWVLQLNEGNANVKGIATGFGSIWMFKQNDDSLLIIFSGKTIKDSFNINEDDILERVGNKRLSVIWSFNSDNDRTLSGMTIQQAYDSGKLSLFRTSIDLYLITFNFNIEVPENEKIRFINGFKVYIKRKVGFEGPGKYIRVIQKSFSLTIARYSNKGNYIVYGPNIKSSDFE